MSGRSALIGLLAFAVAIVAGGWLRPAPARADIDVSGICIDDTVDPGTGPLPAPECAPDGPSWEAPVIAGTTHWYQLSVTPLPNQTLGDVQLVVFFADSTIGSIRTALPALYDIHCFTVDVPPNYPGATRSRTALVCTAAGPVAAGWWATIVFEVTAVVVPPSSGSLDGLFCGIERVEARDLGTGWPDPWVLAPGNIQTTSASACMPFPKPRPLAVYSASAETGQPGDVVTWRLDLFNRADAELPLSGAHVSIEPNPAVFSEILAVIPDRGGCTGAGPASPDTTAPWPIDCAFGDLAPSEGAGVYVIARIGPGDPSAYPWTLGTGFSAQNVAITGDLAAWAVVLTTPAPVKYGSTGRSRPAPLPTPAPGPSRPSTGPVIVPRPLPVPNR